MTKTICTTSLSLQSVFLYQLQPHAQQCCYNTHHSIVKSKLNVSDDMLLKSIDDWEATKKAYDTDKLTKAVLSPVIFVAKYLLLQKALLLP